MLVANSARVLNERLAYPANALYLEKALVRQIKAYMGGAIVETFDCGDSGGLLCLRHNRARNFPLLHGTAPGQLLNHMPVSIACGEVHPFVDLGWILAQYMLDSAVRLNERRPIHSTEKSQAADTVANRHLIGRLLLRLRLNQQLNRQTGFGQPLLDPGKRQSQSGAMPLQTAR